MTPTGHESFSKTWLRRSKALRASRAFLRIRPFISAWATPSSKAPAYPGYDGDRTGRAPVEYSGRLCGCVHTIHARPTSAAPRMFIRLAECVVERIHPRNG